MPIYGNMIGGGAPLKTLILEDENGNEIMGVVTENAVVLTADAKRDIRQGKIAVTDAGIVEGGKIIPSYFTSHGAKKIAAGGKFTIRLTTLDTYDYTVFHGMICAWNTSLSNSVATDRVVILDKVYPVQSTEAIANVTKDDASKSVVLGITNNTDTAFVIRYITYKEID